MIETLLKRRQHLPSSFVSSMRRIHRQLGEQLAADREVRERERSRAVATKEDVGLLLGHGNGDGRKSEELF